jgi:hypothetical protein
VSRLPYWVNYLTARLSLNIPKMDAFVAAWVALEAIQNSEVEAVAANHRAVKYLISKRTHEIPPADDGVTQLALSYKPFTELTDKMVELTKDLKQ